MRYVSTSLAEGSRFVELRGRWLVRRKTWTRRAVALGVFGQVAPSIFAAILRGAPDALPGGIYISARFLACAKRFGKHVSRAVVNAILPRKFRRKGRKMHRHLEIEHLFSIIRGGDTNDEIPWGEYPWRCKLRMPLAHSARGVVQRLPWRDRQATCSKNTFPTKACSARFAPWVCP